MISLQSIVAALALASSAAQAFQITAPTNISSIFKPGGSPQDNNSVTFTLHLNSANLDGLNSRMEQIASSGAPWLTEDQLAQYVSPAADATNAVKQYLSSNGIPDSAVTFNKFGDQAVVTATVAQAKKLFPQSKFQMFEYSNSPIVRALSLFVPDAISSHVFHVGGLLDFPQVRRQAPVNAEKLQAELLAKRGDTTDCNNSRITPSCLRHYYGDYNYTVNAAQKSPVDITVMGYIGQYVSQKDLTAFLTKYRPDAAGYQIPIVTAGGGINDQTKPGIEAMLDVETVIGHAYPLNVNFVSYGTPNDPNDIFAETFDYFLTGAGASQRPSVITISYGAEEGEMTKSQAQAMCNSAQKLTALGTTILVSSGDAGVDGNGQQSGSFCFGTALSPFRPTYPGGCPYIGVVGADTNFNASETMVSTTLPGDNGYFSGAGASNYFNIPRYQATQVAAYDKQLNILQTPPGSYNPKGRRFPDYTANGLNYVVTINNTDVLVGGTSASAPTTASVFGLLNNALKAAGKPTLGWSQPKLYPLGPTAFNDIKTGGSYGCGANSNLTPIGFPAKAGWDNSAGLGSPRFPQLRSGLGA